MPKILRIVNRFNLGGPTFNAAYLSKYLHPEFETKLVGGLKDESEDSSEFVVQELNVDYFIINDMQRSINLKKDWRAYQQIVEIIKDFKPDIVHTHASKAGFLGRMAAIKQNIPVIVHTFHGHVFHSYFGKLKTLFYKLLERYLAKKSTMIIAISDEQKRELTVDHQICNPGKVHVIRLGFDLARFRKDQAQKRAQFRSYYGLDDDEIAIGIVGRLVPIKNHKLFLNAIAKLKKRTKKSFKAFIIGDGSEKEKIQTLTRNLQLSLGNRSGTDIFQKDKSLAVPREDSPDCDITFTSWIREIDYAYAGLDLVCLTSLNEGTPVSLIEAQASGRAVISTKVGGVENIVEHGKTGLLSDISLEEYVTNLLKLVEDSGMRKAMGQEGIHQVNQNYNFLRLVEETRDLYLMLLPSD